MSTVTTNLFTNPVLANNATGWGQAGSTAGARTDTTATIGDWSFRMVRDGTGNKGVRTGNIAVTAGLVYTASIYVVSSVASALGRIDIDWYDGSAVSVGNNNVTAQSIGTDPSNPSRLVITATAPVGAVNARVAAVTTGGTISDTQDYTRLQFEQGPAATAFFHGGFPDTAQYRYDWTGTAHASTSTRTDLETTLRRIRQQFQLRPY